MFISLEIKLNNWALRASNSSSESQEFNGSGIIEGELGEVAIWLEVALVVEVLSLVEVEVVAVEGEARASKPIVLAVEGAGDKGAIVKVASFFVSFSLSGSFSTTSSFSFSFPISYNKTKNWLKEFSLGSNKGKRKQKGNSLLEL